jgi:hypothetical protein
MIYNQLIASNYFHRQIAGLRAFQHFVHIHRHSADCLHLACSIRNKPTRCDSGGRERRGCLWLRAWRFHRRVRRAPVLQEPAECQREVCLPRSRQSFEIGSGSGDSVAQRLQGHSFCMLLACVYQSFRYALWYYKEPSQRRNRYPMEWLLRWLNNAGGTFNKTSLERLALKLDEAQHSGGTAR